MKQTTAEKAFVRSEAGYQFNGKKLQPFTAQRQAAAAGMGLRFGLVDDSDIFSITVETLKGKGKSKTKQKQDLQFYNQMFADVITVMWLCTALESRVMRSLRKPDEAKSEAFKWADAQGITLTSGPYYAAAGVFFQIMEDITVSTAVPQSSNGENEDDDDPNE